MNLKDLQDKQLPWVQHNFGDRPEWQPLLGVNEEVGELFEALMPLMLPTILGHLNHAHLKQVQGIRGTPENHTIKIKDAIGDIVIFLADYCTCKGWDLDEIVTETWEKVSKRDWKVDGQTGGTGETQNHP